MLDEAGALAALTALAQETRLRALRTLLHAYPDGIPAGRLAAAAGCAPSTLTFHLRQLQEAGLVDSRRQGASMIYSARPAGLAGLTDYLTQACCGGRPEACLPVRCRGDAALGPGASPRSPGHEVQDRGSRKGSPGASGHAPGHETKSDTTGTTARTNDPRSGTAGATTRR